MSPLNVALILAAACVIHESSAQLFEFPKPVEYKQDNSNASNSHWFVNGTLNLFDRNLVRFFKPVVNVVAPGIPVPKTAVGGSDNCTYPVAVANEEGKVQYQVCSVDLTQCPPSNLPEGPNACYCSAQDRDYFYLYISQAALPLYSKAELKVAMPLRFSWFKFSKIWEEELGAVPTLPSSS